MDQNPHFLEQPRLMLTKAAEIISWVAPSPWRLRFLPLKPTKRQLENSRLTFNESDVACELVQLVVLKIDSPLEKMEMFIVYAALQAFPA